MLIGDFGYDCLCLLVVVWFGGLIVLVNFFCFCGEFVYLLVCCIVLFIVLFGCCCLRIVILTCLTLCFE